MINVREHQRETLRVRMETIGFPKPIVYHMDGAVLLDFCWPDKALAVLLQPYELVIHNMLSAAGWRVIYLAGSMVFQPYATGILARALGIDLPEVSVRAGPVSSG